MDAVRETTPFGAAASGLLAGATRTPDRVDRLNSLSAADAAAALAALPDDEAVELLDEPELEYGAAILSALPAERAARFLDLVSADRAVDMFRDMRVSVRNDVLALALPETREEIERLLPYGPDCAGGIMTTEFVAVPADWTAGAVLDHVRAVESTRETVYAIFVTDPATAALQAAVPLRRLIAADPATPVLALATGDVPVSVTAQTPLEDTVRMISRYNLLAVAVLDDNRRMVGIVTVDDAIDSMVAEQDAELQQMGGMEPLDAPYLKVSFLELIRKRAGWLCVLFLAEMLTASAMQAYEEQLQKAVVLALFIPLIMSSGGNSGSQATSLIIRALAVRDITLGDWWRVVRRELPAGLTLGAILGLLGATRIAAWQGLGLFDYGPHWGLIALTIFSALIGIVTFGSMMGSILPFIAKRLGFDPAVASGPFVATLVDVTGILIYFSIASVILKGTLL